MRPRVAPLQPRAQWWRNRVGMVRVTGVMIRCDWRGNGMHMRGQTVLMLRVLMTRVGVHVLKRCRPGGREHRADDRGRNGSEHHGECMGSVPVRQTLGRKHRSQVAIGLPLL